MPERPAIRPAAPEELSRLGPVYERSGFGARLAGVVGFARARLDGEVVVAEAGGELVGVAAGAVFTGTGWVGGLLPAASFALVAASGNIYFGLWYSVAFTVVAVVVSQIWLPETKGRDLDTIET